MTNSSFPLTYIFLSSLWLSKMRVRYVPRFYLLQFLANKNKMVYLKKSFQLTATCFKCGKGSDFFMSQLRNWCSLKLKSVAFSIKTWVKAGRSLWEVNIHKSLIVILKPETCIVFILWPTNEDKVRPSSDLMIAVSICGSSENFTFRSVGPPTRFSVQETN